jgi:hypothetical protein
MFRRIVSVIGPTAAAVALVATPASAAATSYSGQATAVRASVFGVNVALADTGPLPSSGGSQSASLIGANVPGVVTADLLTASTTGSGDMSSSSASLVNVSVLDGLVTASIVKSQATASCQGSEAQSSGSSNLVSLVVAGQPVVVVGSPVITIPVLGLTVAVNEQTSSTSGSHGDITVNAVHVFGPGVDIAIASSHADIDCA